MPRAVNSSLGDNKPFFRPKHNIYTYFRILFGFFDLILLFVGQICYVNCETENKRNLLKMDRPSHASFCLFSFFSTILQKICRLQQDSNSDRRSRRWARGSLDHHQGPKIDLRTSIIHGLFIFLKKWANAGLFFVYFWSFQTNNNFFATNQCENMSIQYTALGFEPMTFRTWVITHNH